MENSAQQNFIISKLRAGVKFGLYDGGKTCYFEDGTKVDYQELWDAVRTMNNLGKVHNKTLFELCPDTYKGIFRHRFHNTVWVKKIFTALTRAKPKKLNAGF